MNLIGIMQGRLSPPVDGRIQAFPKNSWREEFAKASDCGCQLIEWIFDAEDWTDNPLFAAPDEIAGLSKRHGVQILSVCADYFLDLPLIRVSKVEQVARLDMLYDLIEQVSRLGVRYITVPFVDNSSIKTLEEAQEVAYCLQQCVPTLERWDVVLALETSLDPVEFRQLLDLVNHPRLKVNYDIGNSAALGYDTLEEIAAYGRDIVTVHVKDRVRDGGTVPLGTGHANFEATFSALAEIGYQGPFILQAARTGDEEETARRYVKFVRGYLDQYF